MIIISFSSRRALLRDEEMYPDPGIFNPERFLKDGEIDPKTLDPIPNFGFGRRCVQYQHSSTALVYCVRHPASQLLWLHIGYVPVGSSLWIPLRSPSRRSSPVLISLKRRMHNAEMSSLIFNGRVGLQGTYFVYFALQDADTLMSIGTLSRSNAPSHLALLRLRN